MRSSTHPWSILLAGLVEPFYSRLVYGHTPAGLSTPITTLLSGSIEDARHLQTECSKTLWMSEAPFGFRKCRQLPPQLRWTILKHEHFGGTSNYRALVGFSRDLSPPHGSTLRRQLRHMVDYSLQPASCVDSPTLSGYYSENDLLDIRNLQKPIIYGTRFCSSQWGSRILTPPELLSICEVTPWVRHAIDGESWTYDKFPVLPSSLLLSCLNLVLPLQHPSPLAPIVTTDFRGPPAHQTKSWLPSLHRFLPHSWIDESVVSEKAAKADDASVPTHMWDRRVSLLFPALRHVLPQLRTLVLRRQRRTILTEIRAGLRLRYGNTWATLLVRERRVANKGGLKNNAKNEEGNTALQIDADEMCQALTTWADSSWWNWDRGSTLLFWRWHPDYQKIARDGMLPFIQSDLPTYQKKARPPKREEQASLATKVIKMIVREYVETGKITSFTDYFTVPKVDDIRPVYNGTSCGLNKALWSPKFWLPTPATAVRCLDYGYHSVDIDLGEMFHNFPLHESLRSVSGVDFSWFDNGLRKQLPKSMRKGPLHLRWTRTWMGCKPSPYIAVRYYYLAEEFARGKIDEKTNALRWDELKLNLPGSAKFDPTLPFVFKWDSLAKCMAGDLTAFVDDLRATGMSPEHAWAVARQVASRLQYLGIQDAARKRRPPVQSPGAWAGAIFSTADNKICKTVSNKKWTKARNQIKELHQASTSQKSTFDYKRLEQIRGFMCHLGMTFDIIMPYLKGFHLALAYHLEGRDAEGWKVKQKQKPNTPTREYKQIEKTYNEDTLADSNEEEWVLDQLRDHTASRCRNAPKVAPMLPQLIQDIDALRRLLEPEEPPNVLVRTNSVYHLSYGFADASGTGFGSTIWGRDGVRYRMGTWSTTQREESSNFREFENVVQALELEEKEERLQNSMIFLCTDNSTVEAALYKGNSSSRKLYALVLRLRILEMKASSRIHVSHVSGERMKTQGTDGISRGVNTEGIATGKSMLEYIPFNLSALERSSELLPWIRSWLGPAAEVLTPKDWFVRGHDICGWTRTPKGFWMPKTNPGVFIWAPPPAAADVALEELRKARIKRQDSMHFVVIPKLFQTKWRKTLYKASDVVFDVPAGDTPWPTHMHEGLTCSLLLPYLPHSPWECKGTPKMFELERQLRRMFPESFVAAGNLLQQFLQKFERIRTMPADVVWKMLHFRPRDPIPYSPTE